MNLLTKIQNSFSRILATVTFIIMLLAIYDVSQQLKALGVFFSLTTFWWQVIVVSIIVACVGLLFVWSGRFQDIKNKFLHFYNHHWFKNKFVLLGLFLIVSLAFSVWVLRFGYIVLNGYYTRLFFFLMVSILGMLFLQPLLTDRSWKIALVGSMLIHAALFKVLIYTFQGVSSSPFSLSWSEGSRYYYSSLYFAKRIYGMDLPLSPLHPSRYFLMAFPFALPNLPITFHRAWQVLLWIVLAGLTGVTLARRMKIRNSLFFVLFSVWVYLFLNLGPVYYHLLVCVILIYWGVDFKKPVQTMFFLLLASIWAGLSRVNWIPVPTFLVLTLYFLERPWNQTDKLWRYLSQPILWGMGILAAFTAYLAYIPLSGNQTSKFGSTFTSDLLWNRLLPNPTYPYGILWGAILVTFPLWLVIFFQYRYHSLKMHPIKLLGTFLMVSTLFFGGLVVSVKIGGGSNLHNMDAYFVLLLTIASNLFWRVGTDDFIPSERTVHPIGVPGWLLTLLFLIPILLILREGGVVFTPDRVKDQRDLSTLQAVVSDVAAEGGEVLFISERQLQVFNLVPHVSFIPEYEKILLMEMAMAGNQAYLARFYKDITSRRFDLIITDSVRMDKKDEIEAFSEEHNVWVDTVITPLLGNYTFQALGGRSSIFILTPK